MAEHLLHSAEVSASFQQMSGKRMAEYMRVYIFFDACLRSVFFHEFPDSHSCKAASALIQEKNIFSIFVFQEYMPHMPAVFIYLVQGSLPDGNYPFLGSFPEYADYFHIEHYITLLQ